MTNQKSDNLVNLTTDNYNRPNVTFTDSLTKEDIINYLQDYELVDKNNIDSIPLGTHIRYITEVDGIKKFRTGGKIIKVDKDYFVLASGRLKWSVQKANTIFFKLISIETVRKELNKIIEEQRKIIYHKELEIKSLAHQLENLKKKQK